MSDEWDVLEDAGFHVSTERTNLPLDDIVGAAGIKNWAALRAWANGFPTEEFDEKAQINRVRRTHEPIEWVINSLRMLTDGAYVMSTLKPKQVEFKNSYFGEQWRTYDDKRPKSLTAHEMMSLLEKGVIRERDEGEPIFSRVVLFKTPKNDNVSRLITCGQEANAACEKTPAVHLPMPEDVIRRMRKLGKAYYVICDEKNSFFQQKIPKEFGRTMGINFEGKVYFMNVLAQGHAWSAKISHELCWARLILVIRSGGMSTLGVRHSDIANSCPIILNLYDDNENIIGFVTVYIDNVLVATTDLGLAHRWKTRIEQNAALHQKVELKNGAAFLYKDGKVEYLGVEYIWNESEQEVQWRWSTDKKNEWVSKHSKPLRSMPWTPREVASWAATIMWTTRIALRPLFEIRDSIELASEAQSLAKRYENCGKWDAKLTSCDVEKIVNRLEKIRRILCDETIHTGKIPPKQEPAILAAVDAAQKFGRGIVFLDTNGDVIQWHWIKPTINDKMDQTTLCAFYLEILIILEAIQRAEARDVTLRFLSDCVPAILCVMRGYSRNKDACDLIEQIYKLLWQTNCQLELRWAPGSVMVADEPSRVLPFQWWKVPICFRILWADLELPRPRGRFYRGVDHEFQNDVRTM